MTIDSLSILYTSCLPSLILFIFFLNYLNLYFYLFNWKILHRRDYKGLSLLPFFFFFFFNKMNFDTSLMSLLDHHLVLFIIIIFLLNQLLLDDDRTIFVIIDMIIIRPLVANRCRFIMILLIKLRKFLLIIKASINILIIIVVESFPLDSVTQTATDQLLLPLLGIVTVTMHHTLILTVLAGLFGRQIVVGFCNIALAPPLQAVPTLLLKLLSRSFAFFTSDRESSALMRRHMLKFKGIGRGSSRTDASKIATARPGFFML